MQSQLNSNCCSFLWRWLTAESNTCKMLVFKKTVYMAKRIILC